MFIGIILDPFVTFYSILSFLPYISSLCARVRPVSYGTLWLDSADTVRSDIDPGSELCKVFPVLLLFIRDGSKITRCRYER